MMKKIVISTLLLGLSLNTFAATYKEHLLSYLSNKSEEIHQAVRADNAINTPKIKNLTEEQLQEWRYLKIDPLANKTKKIQDYFDEYVPNIDIFKPFTIISSEMLSGNAYLLARTLNQDSAYYVYNPQFKPTIIPTEITFFDNSTIKLDKNYKSITEIKQKYPQHEAICDKGSNLECFLWRYSIETNNELVFGLEESRPIKQIKFDITLPVEKINIFTARKAGEIFETEQGKVEILSIKDNIVKIKLPTSLINDTTYVVAYDKNDRALHHNYVSRFSSEYVAAYKAYGKYVEQAKELVKQDEIRSIEQIEEYLAKHASNEMAVMARLSGTGVSEVGFEYGVPVSKLAFALPGEMQNQIFHVTYKNKNIINNEGYALATSLENLIKTEDFNSLIVSDLRLQFEGDIKLNITQEAIISNGILDKDGQWVLKPETGKHFTMLSNGRISLLENNEFIRYNFDTKSKRLQEIERE